MDSTTVDTINAIAGLWKFVLALTILIFILLFRKSLQKTLEGLRNIRYKKGQTEVAVEGGVLETKAGSVSDIQSAAHEPIKVEQTQEPETTFFYQMHEAFMQGRLKDADEAFKKLQEVEESPEKTLKNECIYHYMRYKFANDGGAIALIEKLAEKPKVRADALYWLAACHEYSRNFGKAIEVYRRSLAEELADDKRANRLVALSNCLIQTGNASDALQALTDNLVHMIDPKAKAELYQGIADIHKANGNNMLRAIALQKVLQYTPEETGALFSAAYALGAVEIPTLSATNYSTLLRFKPKNTAALNNLGIECDRLGLPIMCVENYKRAADEKETLAMANLAYRYMNQGFEKEAKDILEQAMHEKDPHKNVGHALANLTDIKEKEDKDWDSIVQLSIKQQQFFWDYAEAYFEPTNPDSTLAGMWATTDGHQIQLTCDADKLSGKWETEKEGEDIQGSLCRHTAKIVYKKKLQALGSWTYWSDPEDGLAFLSRDSNTLNIQMMNKKNVRFFSLTRKKDSGMQTPQTHPTTN